MGSYVLLGEKLGHSLSPVLHEAIYAQLGHTDSQYRSVEVSKDGLADFFAGFAAGAYDGINITVPYKEAAIQFLDQVDARAKRMNAVNCVTRRNGELIGYNTDVLGFAYLLRRNNIEIEGKRCAILGAGGSAQAIATVLAEGGAGVVKVANRSMDKANKLTMFIDALNPDVKTELQSFDELSGREIDLIVNTTSLGMYPQVDASPMQGANFDNVGAVVDIVYNPKQTLLLESAAKAGAKTVNGLEMLVAQAVYSVEIWFGGNVISQIDMDALTHEIAKHI